MDYEDDIVEINDSISIDREDLKDAVMGDVDVPHKETKYNWDKIIEEAIQHGIDLEEQSITVSSDDWEFAYHIETLDQLWGVGL